MPGNTRLARSRGRLTVISTSLESTERRISGMLVGSLPFSGYQSMSSTGWCSTNQVGRPKKIVPPTS